MDVQYFIKHLDSSSKVSVLRLNIGLVCINFKYYMAFVYDQLNLVRF